MPHQPAIPFLLVPAILLTGTLASTPAHAADACDALYQAGIKSIQSPHHVYSTTTMKGGKARSGEAIFDGKAEYLLLNGKWMRSPISHSDMLGAAQEKLKTQPDTCTLVGDQISNGQAVTVYKMHNKEDDTDQTLRILKPDGLLQGGTLKLPDGSLVETRYEYANVRAPAGVQ